MKNLLKSNLWIVMLIASIAIGSTSCDQQEEVVYELPDMTTIICNAGDRPTFSFSAGGNWQLSSDAIWCKFITSSGELQDMSGNAGTHIVTLNISDEQIKDSPTFAHITIRMGKSSAIIATIERGANQLYVKIYDITDAPINNIELGYVDWIPLRVQANFRFAATEFPEWVEIMGGSITGVPGEQTEAYLRIVNNGDRERFPIKADDGYKMVFSDESGEHTFEFPIVYKGMGSDVVTFEGPTSSFFNWEVSLDGKEFRQVNEQDGSLATFNDCLEYHITAHKNEYDLLFVEKIVDRGIPSFTYYEESPFVENGCWMHFNKENMTLTIDPSEVTRHGIVMVLPKQKYNTIRTNIDGYIYEMDDSSGIELPTINYDFQQYIIIEFTQKSFAEVGAYDGMYAYHSITAYEIPCNTYNNDIIMEQYGVTEAYVCPFVNSVEGKRPGIVVDPRIENWTTANYDEGIASAEVWYKGEKLKISEDEYYIGENTDENLAIHLWGPKAGFSDNENIYIVFSVDNTAKKLLVVTPPTK